LQRLEGEIEKLTKKKEQVEGQLEAAQQKGDFAALAQLGGEVAALMTQIEAKASPSTLALPNLEVLDIISWSLV
jgi:ABC-type phosphate transport system auxiliary subunit